MKSFIIFSLIVFFVPLAILPFLHVTSMTDLTLNTNSKIYAGKGEICLTPYTKINCQKGLKCVLISTSPYKNGLCMSENSTLEKDYVSRNKSISQ